jgi:hypothetical protein
VEGVVHPSGPGSLLGDQDVKLGVHPVTDVVHEGHFPAEIVEVASPAIQEHPEILLGLDPLSGRRVLHVLGRQTQGKKESQGQDERKGGEE